LEFPINFVITVHVDGMSVATLELLISFVFMGLDGWGASPSSSASVASAGNDPTS
jgi:hypothetical protein